MECQVSPVCIVPKFELSCISLSAPILLQSSATIWTCRTTFFCYHRGLNTWQSSPYMPSFCSTIIYPTGLFQILRPLRDESLGLCSLSFSHPKCPRSTASQTQALSGNPQPFVILKSPNTPLLKHISCKPCNSEKRA